ncbi:fimbrial protein [Providencia sp. Me31A]|uniref:fimbrial protein n=1 Tax=Providencia sp. Me31A TaxID=3392637 RepID=UPI003D29DAFB
MTSILLIPRVLADDFGPNELEKNITFTLEVIGKAECSITSRGTDLGDVYEAQIVDGGEYKKTLIDYSIFCSRPPKNNAFKMKLSWSREAQINGKSALLTNTPNLGLLVYHDNTLLKNNAVIDFTIFSGQPKLYVIPTKPNGVALQQAGAFNATLVMSLDYQ